MESMGPRKGAQLESFRTG